MSHSSTLKKADEFCDNFDEEVIQWKTDLENSNKKQRIISEVHKVKSCAAKEVNRCDLTTLNVAGLDLSCILQGQIVNENLDVTSIKERVQDLMGRFNPSVSESVMHMVPK